MLQSSHMPARDTFHDVVRNALTKDGWTITHDPYNISFGSRNIYTDLGAHKPLAAERGSDKIALEIKSFVGGSEVRELELGLGQFFLYRLMMSSVDPDRMLLLAIPDSARKSLFTDAAGQKIIAEMNLKLAVFSVEREEIVEWLR
jgi:hypothetical protein